MKIRTLIVDDEALARERIRQLLRDEPEVEVVGECADGLEAVASIQEKHPDLVFLDVQMPGLDGFGVLEKMGSGLAPVVVFVTAHDEFALRAFEVHAVDYLLKPFDRQRFKRALGHALELARHRGDGALARSHAGLLEEVKSRAEPAERIAVKSGAHVVWVALTEIDWIAAADNYAELHVGAKSHLLRETLGALEGRLPVGKFVRISRSVIVNASRIKELHRLIYGGYELALQDGTRLRLSRRYRDQLGQLGLD
jgi:two-component system LytT family response regulator